MRKNHMKILKCCFVKILHAFTLTEIEIFFIKFKDIKILKKFLTSKFYIFFLQFRGNEINP